MRKQVPASHISYRCDYIFLLHQYLISDHGKHFTAVLDALKKKLYLRHPFPEFSDVKPDVRGVASLIDSLPIPDAHRRSTEINNGIALRRVSAFRRKQIDRGDRLAISELTLINP